MSTKIFTGFRFRSQNLFEIHDMVSRWRELLAERHRADLAKLIADMSSDLIDRNTADPSKFAGKTPYSEVRSEIRTRQKEILGSGSRDPDVDFDFELSLLPHGGNVYGMAFCERQSWIDLWMAQGWVEDFSYWNNSDRPDGVSCDDWDARAETWTQILSSNPAGTPGMAGFTAQCVDRFSKPQASQILQSMPAFESRVQRQAKSAAVGKVYDRFKEEERETANPFATLMKIERWLAGDGAHALDEEKERMRSALHPDITEKMVFEPLPGIMQAA
ncbi:hypothetical protein G6L37_00060 [Agrobacterium rubi]|nr:hypothetical protein [Agrobacterium rubi]NTF23643.1 hypothetical protein [Agrobacterium rubi]